MEKKIYNAPYLKVVRVKNDIIATSLGLNNDMGTGVQLAPQMPTMDAFEAPQIDMPMMQNSIF